MWPFKKHNCLIEGHIFKTKRREGYVYPSKNPWRGVADDVVQERQVCKHCSKTTEWEDIERSTIHTLSMGPSAWKILRREDFLRQ